MQIYKSGATTRAQCSQQKKCERYELVVVPICFYMSLAARGKAVMMTTTIKTVADLKKEIPVFISDNGFLMGSRQLHESGISVLYRMERESCDLELNVYENGLVFYRCGKNMTVFRLHKVPDSYYSESDSTVSQFSEELPWEFHLMLYAEDRLCVNQDEKEQRIVIALCAFGKEGSKEMELEDPVNRDPAEYFLRRETVDQIYSWLTEKQANVFRLINEERLTHQEVAERLGMSRAAVANAIVRVYETLRKHKNDIFS